MAACAWAAQAISLPLWDEATLHGGRPRLVQARRGRPRRRGTRRTDTAAVAAAATVMLRAATTTATQADRRRLLRRPRPRPRGRPLLPPPRGRGVAPAWTRTAQPGSFLRLPLISRSCSLALIIGEHVGKRGDGQEVRREARLTSPTRIIWWASQSLPWCGLSRLLTLAGWSWAHGWRTAGAKTALASPSVPWKFADKYFNVNKDQTNRTEAEGPTRRAVRRRASRLNPGQNS